MTLRQADHTFEIATRGAGFHDVTAQLDGWLGRQPIRHGLLMVFIAHTSASLTIQENADPDVLRDLADFFADLVPQARAYRHATEGPDDMPAHIRSALTQTTLAIPVRGGRMALGTWQAVYLFEHRQQPHTRRLLAHLIGSGEGPAA